MGRDPSQADRIHEGVDPEVPGVVVAVREMAFYCVELTLWLIQKIKGYEVTCCQSGRKGTMNAFASACDVAGSALKEIQS